eukprot:8351769-Pyramimonas_sp.AAC.1
MANGSPGMSSEVQSSSLCLFTDIVCPRWRQGSGRAEWRERRGGASSPLFISHFAPSTHLGKQFDDLRE